MTNLELVQRMFEAVAAQDLATLETVLDDNLTFTLSGNSPFAGRTVGRDNVLALLSKLNGELAISNSVHGLYDGPDGVVVHQTGTAPGYDDEALVFFKINNAQVTEAVEFVFDVAAFDRYVEASRVPSSP
ncbi:MAG TPA: nuclear transport factor 2 family protein [Jatrophihabitantaceae bacterium]|jgi:ketosteroid isomerase-like protein